MIIKEIREPIGGNLWGGVGGGGGRGGRGGAGGGGCFLKKGNPARCATNL